jgi:hypothetical protein
MKKYFFEVSCGIGMDSTCVIEFPDDVSEDELNNCAWELAVENAETFGSYWDCEDTAQELQENDEWNDRDFCPDDLEWAWALYDPEKHDQLRAGGGSFMEDFE